MVLLLLTKVVRYSTSNILTHRFLLIFLFYCRKYTKVLKTFEYGKVKSTILNLIISSQNQNDVIYLK